MRKKIGIDLKNIVFEKLQQKKPDIYHGTSV